MRVLFLALGAGRTRAVATESARIVAAGGHAVVLLEKRWRTVPLDPAVELVQLPDLEASDRISRIGRFIVYEIADRIFKVIGRGPFRKRARRMAKTYRRGAGEIFTRVVSPVCQAVWGQGRHRLIKRRMLRAVPFDLIVVTDSPSILAAHPLLRSYRRGATRPSLSFGIDYAEERIT